MAIGTHRWGPPLTPSPGGLNAPYTGHRFLMPRIVVVVIVIVVVVVVVQIPASREAELGRHIRILYVGKTCKFGSKSAHRAMRQKTNRRNVASF